MPETMGYESRGMQNKRENQEVLEQLQAQMEALQQRAANRDENAIVEAAALKKRIDKLRADQGRIEAAGMV